MPADFTVEAAYCAFRDAAGELAAHLARLKQAPMEMLFKVDYGKKQDRESLKTYQGVLHRLLLANCSGIFKKMVLQAGLKKWDIELGVILGKTPDKIRTEAYAIIHMMNTLKHIDKSKTTGERLPRFINDLLSMMAPCERDGIDEGEEVEDEEDEACSSVVVHAELAKQDAMEAMTLLRSKHPKRRLLLRESSCPSECALVGTCAAGALSVMGASSVDAISMVKKPSSSTQGFFWHFAGFAHWQKGTLVEKTDKWEASGGFKLYQFEDGHTWLSEEPVLEPVLVMEKKPAMAKNEGSTRKSSPSSSAWKLLHSKTYHAAKSEFTRNCKIRGVEVGAEAMKQCIQAKLDKARSSFFEG